MNFFSFEMSDALTARVRITEEAGYMHTSDSGLRWYVPVSVKLESDGPIVTKKRKKFLGIF